VRRRRLQYHNQTHGDGSHGRSWCGTHDDEEHRGPPRAVPHHRRLNAAHCTASYNNPHEQYDPYSGAGKFTIRVVIHSIMEAGCTNYACGFIDDACLQSGITMLNEDFRGTATGTDSGIEFALATQDPWGASTPGIVRYVNTAWFTHPKDTPGGFWGQVWDQDRYLNVFLQSPPGTTPGTTLLGYATYPFYSSSRDGMVVRWDRWGQCANGGDAGTTASHEVGHYLGLKHTFAPVDTSTQPASCPPRTEPHCYSSGDLICDTYPEGAIHYSCSQTSSCGGPDPLDNYMAYTDAGCMTEFTTEQIRRMRCAMAAYRPLVYDVSPMPPSPPAPSSAPAPIALIGTQTCACRQEWTYDTGCRNQNGCSTSPACDHLAVRVLASHHPLH
jgi:hypothetical protein